MLLRSSAKGFCRPSKTGIQAGAGDPKWIAAEPVEQLPQRIVADRARLGDQLDRLVVLSHHRRVPIDSLSDGTRSPQGRPRRDTS
jgi:hypothetical protein